MRHKQARYGAILDELERTGENQISLTDPDSRAMAAHTKVGFGYNVQIAVDAKHKLIAEQAVTNDVLDMGLLQQTAASAREILGVETIDVVADKGYFRTEDIAACEKAGLIPHLPRPQRGSAVREGFFRKDEFRYDAKRDAYSRHTGSASGLNSAVARTGGMVATALLGGILGTAGPALINGFHAAAVACAIASIAASMSAYFLIVVGLPAK